MGIYPNINKSSTHWLYLHRINDCALTHTLCYSCQVLLLFLSLRCAISVRFTFRSGTQEKSLKFWNISIFRAGRKVEESNCESLYHFCLSFTVLFFFLSHVSHVLQVTVVPWLWTTVPYNWQICSQLCGTFVSVYWHFRQYPLKSSDLIWLNRSSFIIP